jgi:hypothetical protein
MNLDMKYIDGMTFSLVKCEEILDYLKSRKLTTYQLRPSSLNICSDMNNLILQFTNGKLNQYPVRRSFLYKLLNWYKFPLNQLEKLSIDTIVNICNDFLLNIKREYVNVLIENNEALTITSPGYSEITDIEIFKNFDFKGIRVVSRDDFVTRMYFEEKIKIEPNRGDSFGFGFNILNSETGFHSLSFKHFLFRYICSNGAFITEDISNNFLYHYKNSKEKLLNFINDNISSIDNKRQIVHTSLMKAANDKVSDNFDKIKKKIRQVIGSKDAEEFLNGFNRESNRYEFFNHITESAKSYDFQKLIRLETIAGDLLMK